MTSRDTLLLIGVAVLTAVVQLLAVSGGAGWALAGGIADGLLLVAAIRVFSISVEGVVLPALAAAGASLVGLAAGMLGSGAEIHPAAWAAPALAAAAPAAVWIADRMRAPKCRLCRRQISQRKRNPILAFTCPRCNFLACEYCWEFEKCRCRLCEANQVALFPGDRSWWAQRMGNELSSGKCSLCFGSGEATSPLHACPKCHYGQCQRCWDDNNGQCGRCRWSMPDLPSTLHEYVMLGRSTR